MKKKPYANYTKYDVFYLEICRDLYKIIDELLIGFDYDDDVLHLNENDRREMAYSLTAYFEDQVNDIGFWKSLTALHHRHFGKRLPFFEAKILQQQEEEWDDVLPADIHYLVYIQYLNLVGSEGKEFGFFNTLFFTALTESVVEYFAQKEEIFTTKFYENHFVPQEDYVDFKKQADWFTYSGYITGIEFSRRLNNYLWKLKDKETEDSLMMPMMYAERDRLLFEEPSSFTAFFPVDILAGVMQCNEEKKAEISNLKWRPHGIFTIQKETDTHYSFLHTSTGESFEVIKSSFGQTFDSMKENDWIAKIACWNGVYNISGMCLPSPYEGDEINEANLEMQQAFQKHFAKYRKHIEEIASNYQNNALKFFGARLLVFDTGQALQNKLNEFDQWYFDTITIKTNLSEDTKPLILKLPEKLLSKTGLALFIPPTDGLQIVYKHPQLINLLQTDEADEVDIQQKEEVFAMLSDDSIGKEYWLYVKKNFPIPNLSLFIKCPSDADEDFEALLRIYLPDEFSPLNLPRFTAFNSENNSPRQ